MTTKNVKKLEDLTQKIESLKAEKTKIQQELIADFTQVLQQTDAFQVDFHTLVGALLHCLDKAKINPDQKKEWQETGRKFCKNRLAPKQRRAKKESKSPPKTMSTAA